MKTFFSQLAFVYFRTFKNILIENKWFFLGICDWIILGVLLQMWFSQFELTLAINSIHNGFRDLLFKYLTFAGDGLFALALLIFIFIWNRKYLFSALLCFYIPSLITQLFKHFIFSDEFRPAILMKDFSQLHYVDGEYINILNSFPSGHATDAFAIATFFSIVVKNKKWQPLFLILAVLVAISRVYLLQHFFRDVFAGSVIGVLTGTFIFAAFRLFFQKKDITDF
ncbi:MAG: phosphatase PAP2 family protein [Bacteroidia bacterium]